MVGLTCFASGEENFTVLTKERVFNLVPRPSAIADRCPLGSHRVKAAPHHRRGCGLPDLELRLGSYISQCTKLGSGWSVVDYEGSSQFLIRSRP